MCRLATLLAGGLAGTQERDPPPALSPKTPRGDSTSLLPPPSHPGRGSAPAVRLLEGLL